MGTSVLAATEPAAGQSGYRGPAAIALAVAGAAILRPYATEVSSQGINSSNSVPSYTRVLETGEFEAIQEDEFEFDEVPELPYEQAVLLARRMLASDDGIEADLGPAA
jgi:hypothetical protein